MLCLGGTSPGPAVASLVSDDRRTGVALAVGRQGQRTEPLLCTSKCPQVLWYSKGLVDGGPLARDPGRNSHRGGHLGWSDSRRLLNDAGSRFYVLARAIVHIAGLSELVRGVVRGGGKGLVVINRSAHGEAMIRKVDCRIFC